MKKQLQAGLIVEGNSTNSTVLRLPRMPEELGPVKSQSLRVARRFSNLLRAGYAVADYEGLQAAGLILLRVPDRAVSRIVEELSRSELTFKNISIVLCESWLSADVLEPLRARGASVATLLRVPSTGRTWFVVEGQLGAVRQIRRLIELNEARVLELRPGTKRLYFAAVQLTTTVPIPLFLAAQEALRRSGMSGNHLHGVLTEMARSMFRDLSKRTRIGGGGPSTQCSEEAAKTYLEALRRQDPQLAEILTESMAWAKRKIPKKAARDLFREASGS